MQWPGLEVEPYLNATVWVSHELKQLQWFGSGSNPHLQPFKRVGTLANTTYECTDSLLYDVPLAW